MLFAYGIIGFLLVQALYFVAIARLNVSVALILEFTAPIWIVLWLRFVKHKVVPQLMWIAIFLAFGGLVLIAQVWKGRTLDPIGVAAALLDGIVLASFFLLGEKLTAKRDVESLMVYGFGFAYGFYIIITRKLSNSDSSLLTLIMTGVIGTIVMTPTLAFVWVTPSKEQWFLLFLIGVVTMIGHLLLILSFKFSEASKLAPLSYFEIVSNTIVGYLLFKNFPDNWTLIGLFIIISSGLFVFYREKKIGII